MGLLSSVAKIAGAAGSRRRGAGMGGTGVGGTGVGGTGVGGTGVGGTGGGSGGSEAQMAGGLLRKFLRKR